MHFVRTIIMMIWETSGDQAETRVVGSVTRVLVIKIQRILKAYAQMSSIIKFGRAKISHFQEGYNYI